MKMSHLFSIHGLEGKLYDLKEYLRNNSNPANPRNLWIDPCTETCAVVFFDQQQELQEVKNWIENLAQKSLRIEAIKPTWSVLVQINDVKQENMTETLKNLCSSVTGGVDQVLDLKSLGRDHHSQSFEISFRDAWNTVLLVSSHPWELYNVPLTVVPYFDCFKELLEGKTQKIQDKNQYSELSTGFRYSHDKKHQSLPVWNQNENSSIHSQSMEPNQMGEHLGRQVYQQFCSQNQTSDHIVGASSSNMEWSENENKSTNQMEHFNPDMTHAIPRLEHPYIAVLLKMLNFKQATVTLSGASVVETEGEIEIFGHFKDVDKLQNMLTHEDKPVQEQFEKNLLTNKKYQQQIMACVNSGGYYVELKDTGDKILLRVVHGNEKMGFQEFVSGLVKSFSDFKEHEECSNKETVSTGKTPRPKDSTMLLYHPILLRIFSALNLSKVIIEHGFIQTFTIDEKERSIRIRGDTDAVEVLRSKLSTYLSETSDADHWEEFLTDSQVLQEIDSLLKDRQIITDEKSDVYIMGCSGEKMTLKTFISEFIKTEKFPPLPVHLQANENWQSLHKYAIHKQHHIKFTDDNVFLIKVDAKSDPMDSTLRQDVYKTISSLTSCGSSNQSKNRISHNSAPNKSATHDTDGREIGFQLKDLSTSVHREMSFVFPGLLSFLETKGSDVIKNLSEKHNCVIELPRGAGSEFDQNSDDEQQQQLENSARPQYRVTVLLTAKNEKTKVHLIKGNMEEMNLSSSSMKIELQASAKVNQCDIKDTGFKKIIYLPPWRALKNLDIHSQFEDLRSSFHECLLKLLNKAELNKFTAVCISTAKFQDLETDRSFPSDVIAKSILEQLLSNQPGGANEFDVYICEPKNEALLKAFQFFLKMRWSIQIPDHGAWEKICYKEQNQFLDYKKMDILVDVRASNSSIGNGKALFCYPIDSSLDFSICPFIYEPFCDEKLFRSSIQELQRKYPSGFSENDASFLKLFLRDKDIYVYCSTEWSTDSEMYIYKSLDNCLKTSSSYKEVSITPLGLHGYPKYPVKYLAHTYFKALDNILSAQTLHGHKKISFVVSNKECRTAFENELQIRSQVPRRSPKKEVKTKVSRPIKWIKITNDKEPKVLVTENEVPATKITFTSLSEENIHNAYDELQKTLQQLMNESSKMIELSRLQAESFQKLMKGLQQDICVSVIWQTHYEENKQGQTKPQRTGKKGKKKKFLQKTPQTTKVISQSVLTICGLEKDSVSQFTSVVNGSCPGSDRSELGAHAM